MYTLSLYVQIPRLKKHQIHHHSVSQTQKNSPVLAQFKNSLYLWALILCTKQP